MSQYLCHDFKTPRTDTSRRLPPSMRIVPVIFFAVLALGAASGVRDYLAMRKADEQTAAANARKEDLAAQKAQLDGEAANIALQRKRAENIAQWVEGTRIMQPLAVTIARAIPPETDITSLLIERNAELPSQLSLTMHLLNGGMPEFAKIESSISKLNYRMHSPQQDKQGEAVEFRSMLVYQNE